MILDVAVFVIVLFARRITADWHNHRALLDIANLVAALAIAATTFRALPDVILRLTIFVEPGDPIFTSDMLLRALGFALGAAGRQYALRGLSRPSPTVSMTLNAMTSSAGANTPCNTVTNCSSIPKSFHPKTQLKEPNDSHSAPSQRVPPLSSLP